MLTINFFKFTKLKTMFKLPCINVSNYKRPSVIKVNENYVNILKQSLNSKEQLSTNEWHNLRKLVLESNRNFSNINIDATILGFCASNSNLNIGKSYVNYLKSINVQPNFGAIGKLLKLYYVAYMNNNFTEENKKEVTALCNQLTEQNKDFDSSTLDHIIHGFCITDEWKRSLAYLNDIKFTCTPNASTYSVIISHAFKSNDIPNGWNLLNEMITNQRKPKCDVFISWTNYCKTLNETDSLNSMEIMLKFIGDNDLKVSKVVANVFKEYFESLNSHSRDSQISQSGKCSSCGLYLNSISISSKDFILLSSSFLEKVLVRKDVFLRSTPEEIKKFELFLEKTKPFDIVIDGLNVAFSTGIKKPPKVYAKILSSVVKYFSNKRQHILVLGRKHMERWPKFEMDFIRKNSSLFLTDNLSQDDPFLLYAALKSGRNTNIFSRDLMRSHAHLLGTELQPIFRRWQQEHQYSLISANDYGKISIKEPIKFCTSAHKIDNTWHIPFVEDNLEQPITIEVPNSWLCIQIKNK